MNLNMSIKNIMDWMVAEVDASFVEVRNKRNSVVDASLLVLVELVDVLLHLILI